MDLVLEKLRKMNDIFRAANLDYGNILEKLKDDDEFLNEEEELQIGSFKGTLSLISDEAQLHASVFLINLKFWVSLNIPSPTSLSTILSGSKLTTQWLTLVFQSTVVNFKV